MKKALEIIGEALSQPLSHQQALQALRDVRDALIYPSEMSPALPCVIGDYFAARQEMATVLFDDKKIAECYTNEDAEFVAAAINAAEANSEEPAPTPQEPTLAEQSACPNRAYRLTLVVDADTPAALSDALFGMSERISRGEVSTGVSGAPSNGSIYELLHDAEQTHETYFQRVREYLKRKQPADATDKSPLFIEP